MPLATNVAAHLMGVEMAWRNRSDVSIAATLGASIHIALFMAPLLVFLSLLLGHPMDLIFSPLELVALAAASGVATLVAHDGASNWLEGDADGGVCDAGDGGFGGCRGGVRVRTRCTGVRPDGR
ncbi:MAG: hypothetical protein U0470_05035 [Anaerolineae bacterium]